jgi:2-polyprenyl-3-methyl-5-hydroxy-6-metoxy-1,4-benzoquinol methylase
MDPMTPSFSPCPACAGRSSREHSIYNTYPLLHCQDCTLVFTAMREFPADQYEDVYARVTIFQMMMEDARATAAGEKGFKDLWWFKKMALYWLRREAVTGRLLDVGSGPGTFLMVARQRGFAIQGVELARVAASAAQEFGVPTWWGTLEDFAKSEPEPFDAVTSFEVLEHLPDPASVLQSMRSLMKPGARLILSVPNLDDPYCLLQQIEPAMPPIHINFYSRRSMRALLSRAGFRMERSFTLPIPTSSVRNIHGMNGFLRRLPGLCVRRLVGRADGTTLLVSARLAG